MIRTLSLLLLLPATATAQTLPDEVVTTATRLPESALDVAGTVNVLDSDALARIAPLHSAEALNAVAGVGIHQGSGQEHLTAIRSPVLTGGAGAGSFLYLEDGVPTRAAGFGNVNGLFEIGTEFADAIEVTKGPGSVLYGSNAQHGLVNFLSLAPGAGGRTRLQVSDDGQATGLVSLSGRRTRVSLNLATDDGFRDDSGYDQQKLQLRHDNDPGVWEVSMLASLQNLNQETAGFLQEGERAYENDELIAINQFPEAYRDAWSARAQARFTRELSGGTLALTPFARATEIAFLRHFVPGQAREEQKHAGGGLLATYYGDDWIVGLDAEVTQGSLFEFQDNPTRFSFVQGLHYDYEVGALVLSPYAQREFALGPDTTLTAGARLDYTRYSYDNLADVATVGRFQRIADRDDEFVTLTPKLTVVHRLDADTSLYAKVARGARAPQTSDLYSLQSNQVAGEIEPETLDMVEAGVKLRRGSWRVDAAAYAMRKDNFFFRNANGFNVTDGKTEHLGVEVAVDGQLTDWLRLSADLALADQTYAFTELVDSASSSIRDGDEVDTAPSTLARIGLVAQVTDALTLSADLRHVGSYKTDPGNTRSYPGHEVVDLRADYEVREGASVFLRVENALDTNYADRADFAFGNDRYFPGRPRHVFVGVDVSWD